MLKILKYSFYEMIRSRWVFIYTGFYLLVTLVLLYLSNDLSKVLITLNNVVLVLCPLIGILFGIIYYYNNKEFIQLLLGQALSRWSIFLGMYMGIAVSLCLSVLLGVGIPFLLYGIFNSPDLGVFVVMMGMACVLSIVFSAIAFIIGIRNDNRVRGLGIAIFVWLFLAILYDGIFLLLLLSFKDYPLDKLSLALIIFNPIDLARILILMKLDISAMMGYTGAVLQKFLGKGAGLVYLITSLSAWIGIPLLLMRHMALKKDF